MKQMFVTLVIIFSLFFPTMRSMARDAPPPLPETTVVAPNVGEPGPSFQSGSRSLSMAAYVANVVQEANRTWADIFPTWGHTYVPPTYVLVDAGSYARSGCGINAGNPAEDPALSPAFYCLFGGEVGTQLMQSSDIFETRMSYTPVIYLSIPWLEGHVSANVTNRDVAVAYLVTYELSLHVEYLLGTIDRTGGGCCDYPDLRVHLWADCLTGAWAFSAYDRGQLDEADVEAAQGAVWGDPATLPEEFGLKSDHGTPEQRLMAFRIGFERGMPSACFQSDLTG